MYSASQDQHIKKSKTFLSALIFNLYALDLHIDLSTTLLLVPLVVSV